MENFLPKTDFIRIPFIKGLVKDYQACALNSIITILNMAGFNEIIATDEIKDIFDYNDEGISDERYRFHKLNTLLRRRKIPYRLDIQKYDSLNDIYKFMKPFGQELSLPVPIFFQMKILRLTAEKYKSTPEPDLGDVFQSGNKHVLLFVGYEGEAIYFIDPSYQMPFIPESEKDLTPHYFKLYKKDFYGCIKGIKTAIQVRYSKTDAKKYIQEAKNKQMTL